MSAKLTRSLYQFPWIGLGSEHEMRVPCQTTSWSPFIKFNITCGKLNFWKKKTSLTHWPTFRVQCLSLPMPWPPESWRLCFSVTSQSSSISLLLFSDSDWRNSKERFVSIPLLSEIVEMFFLPSVDKIRLSSSSLCPLGSSFLCDRKACEEKHYTEGCFYSYSRINTIPSVTEGCSKESYKDEGEGSSKKQVLAGCSECCCTQAFCCQGFSQAWC